MARINHLLDHPLLQPRLAKHCLGIFFVKPGQDNHMARYRNDTKPNGGWLLQKRHPLADKSGMIFDRKASHYFWQVEVHDSIKFMHRRHKYLHGHGCNDDFAAIVMPRKIIGSKDPHRAFFLGYVLFTKEFLNAEVIAHESLHMAAEFLRRTRRSLRLSTQCDDREERLAYATGSCTNQIALFLHKKRLVTGTSAKKARMKQ